MNRAKAIAGVATLPYLLPAATLVRGFRSDAAIDALQSFFISSTNNKNGSGVGRSSSLILYNYPSFTGAYAALFAHLHHSLLRLPSLSLPFSSVEPFRIEDFGSGGALETCYLLDFIGPKRFAVDLSRIIPRVVAFDHRQSTLVRISQFVETPKNLELHIDTSKSSARIVYDYFLQKIAESHSQSQKPVELLNGEDRVRVENILRYVEDADLRRCQLSDIKAFKIGIKDEMARLNCVTNPYVFEQLLEIDCKDLIAKGNSYANSRRDAVNKLLEKPFKIRLGRGAYGECLAIRADGNSDLSHEMCLELSRRSAAAGFRPIGAVVYMQRCNLKMCLRSSDSKTDTSEIARAYGGGGKPSSSSFIIRMDEYNHWTASY